MESTRTVVRFLGGRYGDRKYCRYFPNFRRHELEWKPVTLRTTGREITKLGHNVRMMPAQFAGPIAPLLARHNNVTTLGGASFQMPPMRSRRQRGYAPMLVLSRLNANAAAWLKVGTCYGRKH
jgi:hypothetical protein